MIILYLYNYIKSKLNNKLHRKNNNHILNNIYKKDKVLITIYEDIELV